MRSGSRKKWRASSRASRQSFKSLLSRMRSSRSPCSPVAASVQRPAPSPQSLTNRLLPRGPLDVARDPVAAVAASVGKIGAAHRLGLRGEAARQFGCGAHDDTYLLAIGCRKLQAEIKRRIEQEEPRQGLGAGIGLERQKQPQAPGDDLAEEAEALELLDFGVAEAGQLDALRAHDRRNAQAQAAAKRDRPCLVEKRGHARLRRKR